METMQGGPLREALVAAYNVLVKQVPNIGTLEQFIDGLMPKLQAHIGGIWAGLSGLPGLEFTGAGGATQRQQTIAESAPAGIVPAANTAGAPAPVVTAAPAAPARTGGTRGRPRSGATQNRAAAQVGAESAAAQPAGAASGGSRSHKKRAAA